MKGYKIIELPISYKYRKYNQTNITFADGIETLLVLLKLRYFTNSKLINYCYKIYKYHVKSLFNFFFNLFK